MLVVLFGGWALWQSGVFGFLPIERELVVRLKLPYAEVRSTDVQLWAGDELIRAETRSWPTGLNQELSVKASLAQGSHHVIAEVQLTQGPPKLWRHTFEIGSGRTQVVELR